MTWHQWCFRYQAEDEGNIQLALNCVNYYNFSCSFIDDDHILTCFCESPSLPQTVLKALAKFDLDIVGNNNVQNWYDDQIVHELGPGIYIGTGLKPADADIMLYCDAHFAFGDGAHSSTRLAAQHIRQHIHAYPRVLDCGCGTGALGMLAQALGAHVVAYSDVDADSVASTQTNLHANGMTGPVWQSDLLNDIPSGYQCDLLIANIYADFLVPLLASEALQKLSPSGIILAGFRGDRCEDIQNALNAAGYSKHQVLAEAEWRSIYAYQ